MIPNWRRFAGVYADEEDLIFDWLNDLDSRKIIDEILNILPYKERILIELELKSIDNLVIEKTFEINECVWGEKVERDRGFNRIKHWHYYRVNQKVFESEHVEFTKR